MPSTTPQFFAKSESDDAKSASQHGGPINIVSCRRKVLLATAENWEAGATPALPPQR